MNLKKEEIAKMIDHTLLKPEASLEGIETLCREAKENGFASVCVNPCYVAKCRELLQGTGVKVCTVIGFPLGANTPEVKVFETQNAIQNGAEEVDMVVNVGAVKSEDLAYVKRDIQAVFEAAAHRAVVKVILENCLLTDEEKVSLCEICKEVGVDFVKTSTGFSTGGAVETDVALMRKTVGKEMGVKAAGGIRSKEDALKMIKAGASRLGCSAGLKIIQDLN